MSTRFCPRQRQCLAALQDGPLSTGDLNRLYGTTDKCVRRLLKKLERKGLVRRCGTAQGRGRSPAIVWQLCDTPDIGAIASVAYSPQWPYAAPRPSP